MKKIYLLFAMFAFIFSGVVAGKEHGLNDLNLKLEHFQCYPVLEGAENSDKVFLIDQFNPNGESVLVSRALRFCNPTVKIHDGKKFGINDPDHHLTFYATYPSAQPNRIVSLVNQFGKQKLRLRDARVLAVPTQKFLNHHNAPESLDHFRCYQARGKSFVQTESIFTTKPLFKGGIKVGLSDQFIPKAVHKIIEPVAFCNPVEKIHNDVPFKIEHPESHLTCYSMTRVEFEKTFAIGNQFQADSKIHVGSPDTLCVPTKKIKWMTLPDVDVPVEKPIEGSVGSLP